MEENLTRLNIKVHKKLHKRLKVMAAIKNKSLYEYINEMIVQFVASKEAQDIFDKLKI
jgi:predicted HicB family RNase H-like nuclease